MREVDENVVARVTGLEASVATVSSALDRHVAEVRDFEVALQEKNEIIFTIRGNADRMMANMQPFFGYVPCA